MPRIPTCRGCGAIIDFVELKSGAKMPVDPEYVEYNDAETDTKLVTDQGNIYVVRPDKNYPSVRGRISHFSTCPKADDFRKR